MKFSVRLVVAVLFLCGVALAEPRYVPAKARLQQLESALPETPEARAAEPELTVRLAGVDGAVQHQPVDRGTDAGLGKACLLGAQVGAGDVQVGLGAGKRGFGPVQGGACGGILAA